MNLPILRGRANARRKLDLARAIGTSTRDVEHEIERLRKAGAVAICSDSQVGYWLPESPEEYAENLAGRRRRAIGQLVTVRGERAALRRWQGAIAAVEQVGLWT